MRVRFHRLGAIVALVVLAGSGLVALAQPSFAAGTLTSVSWAVSNSEVAATSVSYTYQFTTATSGTVSSVTMSVPTGTAGTPAIGTVYGIGAGVVALAGTNLTYSVTTPATIAAGTPVYIQITGLTNTAVAGSYTSTVTTDSSLGTLDTGTSQSVTFGLNNTAVTVAIPQSLTFTNSTPSFQFDMDPSLPALADASHTVTLTVTTNAGKGYTLSVADAGLKATSGSTTYTIPPASTGTGTGVSTFPSNAFGVSATLTSGGVSGAALQGSLATSGDYVGYTTTGQTFLSATGPTGNSGDSLALDNQVKISYSTPAGIYTDTITYTATPSY